MLISFYFNMSNVPIYRLWASGRVPPWLGWLQVKGDARQAARESWIDPLEFLTLLASVREKLLAVKSVNRAFKNKLKILKQASESQSSPGGKFDVSWNAYCTGRIWSRRFAIHGDAHSMKVLCPSRHAPIEWLQATHYLRIIKGVKLPAEIVKLASISFI